MEVVVVVWGGRGGRRPSCTLCWRGRWRRAWTRRLHALRAPFSAFRRLQGLIPRRATAARKMSVLAKRPLLAPPIAAAGSACGGLFSPTADCSNSCCAAGAACSPSATWRAPNAHPHASSLGIPNAQCPWGILNALRRPRMRMRRPTWTRASEAAHVMALPSSRLEGFCSGVTNLLWPDGSG